MERSKGASVSMNFESLSASSLLGFLKSRFRSMPLAFSLVPSENPKGLVSGHIVMLASIGKELFKRRSRTAKMGAGSSP